MKVLTNYQNDGVRFLAPRDTALLTDDAGLGKTAQFIRAADANLVERILIVCQSISTVSWQIELPKWSLLPRPIHCITKLGKSIPMGPVAAIVTYDWLGRHYSTDTGRRALRKMFQAAERFDVVVADEVQSMKSPDANRTKAFYGPRLDLSGVVTRFGLDRDNPPKVWVGSATPTPNHAGELFTHLRALFPQVLLDLFHGNMPSVTEFEDRFCHVDHAGFGRRVLGNKRKNIPALVGAIQPFWLGRTKRDVLPELGEIISSLLPMQVDKAAQTFAALAPADAANMSDDELLAHFAANNQDVEGEATHIAQIRRELGMAKAKSAIQWVRDFLNDRPTEKLVVFSYHRDVMDEISAAFAGANSFRTVRIDGSTPDRKRREAVNAFQNDPHTRLFNGQIVAAGTSITLTAAHHVLIIEAEWTPANNYQAISRCHRMGQTEPVMAFYAYAAGTLDERLTSILRRKAQDAEQLTGKSQGGYV